MIFLIKILSMEKSHLMILNMLTKLSINGNIINLQLIRIIIKIKI